MTNPRGHKSVPTLLYYPQNNQIEQKVEGVVRLYNILGRPETIKRLENNMLMLFGTLLSFAGLFGSILEMRLRKK